MFIEDITYRGIYVKEMGICLHMFGDMYRGINIFAYREKIKIIILINLEKYDVSLYKPSEDEKENYISEDREEC